MRFRNRTCLLACLLALGLLPAGCAKKAGNAGPASRGAAPLGEIYEMVSDYVKSHGKAPAGVDSLKQSQPIYPAGFQALKSGECVVVWGAKPDKAGSAGLGYEKDAPQKGGAVLLSNGKVKAMTAQEFEAAKKGSG